MGQKEIPGSGSVSGTLLDERTNGSQDLVIDPEMVQEVRLLKGKIKSIEPKQTGATFEEVADEMVLTGKEHPFIRGLASSTNRNIGDVKQLIVDKMNEAYPPGDPKRVTMQDCQVGHCP